MQLRDVMTRGVQVIHPDATLAEAAEKMKSLDIGPLPVCDGEKLVGMITDRDLATRAISAGKDPNATRVHEVMTEGVRYCFEDDDIKTAAEIMGQAQIRRLPILSRNKRLVGIVSLGDLAIEPETD